MNLRNKFVNIAATAALVLSAGASIASAAPEADTTLNVVCPETPSVGVTVSGEFSVDASAEPTGETPVLGIPYYDSNTLEQAFEVTVDLTCVWSNDWEVTAEIHEFEYRGADQAPGTVSGFHGSHLYLTNGNLIDYSGPDYYLVAGEPDIEEELFGLFDNSDPAMGNGEDFFGIITPWFQIGTDVPIASPGVSVARWDGQLRYLPINLASGEYVAPLTVSIVAD